MKMYNENGDVAEVEKEQVSLMIEDGWSKKPIEKPVPAEVAVPEGEEEIPEGEDAQKSGKSVKKIIKKG
jgi:hypothetical protein